MKRLTTENKQFANLFDYLSAKKNTAKAQFDSKNSQNESKIIHKNASYCH